MRFKKTILLLSGIFTGFLITASPVFSWNVIDIDATPSVIPADGQSTSSIDVRIILIEVGESTFGMVTILDPSYRCVFTETGTYWGVYYWAYGDPGLRTVTSTLQSNPTLVGDIEIQGRTYNNRMSVYITCFNVEIIAPAEFPAYVGVDDNLSLTAAANPSGITGTYTWSKVSGPGDATFSNPNSANTNFSSDTPGMYKVKCEFLASGATSSYTVESGEIWVVSMNLTGPESLTRGTNGTYTMSVTPSNSGGAFKWKFSGGGEIITEETGFNNNWSGPIVTSGTIEATTVFGGTQFVKTINVSVNPRNWEMAVPPSAQEVVAPAWDGTIGRGEALYQNDNEIQGDPGYVTSGPNKGFYYIADANYWENWNWFHWWITSGFRTSNGEFWVKTKQEEGYTDQQVAGFIQGMIGHETDGTGTGTFGHRKMITDQIQGNAQYDSKAAVELLVVYEDRQQLEQIFQQLVVMTNQKFQKHYTEGKEHPAWGNATGWLWYRDPQSGEWIRGYANF